MGHLYEPPHVPHEIRTVSHWLVGQRTRPSGTYPSFVRMSHSMSHYLKPMCSTH
jgi:hypothetical protein